MCTVSSICGLFYYVCARDCLYVFMCELVSICILFHSSVLAVWWSLKHGNPGIISYPVPLWSTNGNPVSAKQRNLPHTNTHAHFTYSHRFLTPHMFLSKAYKITCTNAQILHRNINIHAVAYTHLYLHKHTHTYQIGRAVGGFSRLWKAEQFSFQVWRFLPLYPSYINYYDLYFKIVNELFKYFLENTDITTHRQRWVPDDAEQSRHSGSSD